MPERRMAYLSWGIPLCVVHDDLSTGITWGNLLEAGRSLQFYEVTIKRVIVIHQGSAGNSDLRGCLWWSHVLHCSVISWFYQVGS